MTKISSTQIVVAYRDDTDSNHGTAKIGTVSGADITFGSEVEFLTGTLAAGDDMVSVDTLDSSNFLVGYRDDTASEVRGEVGNLSLDPYATVAAATKVAFVGWLKNPSA